MSESKKPFVRSPYNYDRNHVSDLTGLSCGEPTRAQQQFKDECDINTIMRRFGKTGTVPAAAGMPEFADFTEVGDFHSSMNAIAKARESFDELPSPIRLRFNNDPGSFVDFCLNPDNRAEAVSIGLIKPVDTPVPPPPTSPDTGVPAPSGAPSSPPKAD